MHLPFVGLHLENLKTKFRLCIIDLHQLNCVYTYPVVFFLFYCSSLYCTGKKRDSSHQNEDCRVVFSGLFGIFYFQI